jgi:hypothetical protein
MRDFHRGRTRPDSRSYFVFVVDTVIQTLISGLGGPFTGPPDPPARRGKRRGGRGYAGASRPLTIVTETVTTTQRRSMSLSLSHDPTDFQRRRGLKPTIRTHARFDPAANVVDTMPMTRPNPDPALVITPRRPGLTDAGLAPGWPPPE